MFHLVYSARVPSGRVYYRLSDGPCRFFKSTIYF